MKIIGNILILLKREARMQVNARRSIKYKAVLLPRCSDDE
jgi:hypothetical protein